MKWFFNHSWCTSWLFETNNPTGWLSRVHDPGDTQPEFRRKISESGLSGLHIYSSCPWRTVNPDPIQGQTVHSYGFISNVVERRFPSPYGTRQHRQRNKRDEINNTRQTLHTTLNDDTDKYYPLTTSWFVFIMRLLITPKQQTQVVKTWDSSSTALETLEPGSPSSARTLAASLAFRVALSDWSALVTATQLFCFLTKRKGSWRCARLKTRKKVQWA